MDEHRELIQRAVEARRKFYDAPRESEEEELHYQELRGLIREAESYHDDTAAELAEACRLDYQEQRGED